MCNVNVLAGGKTKTLSSHAPGLICVYGLCKKQETFYTTDTKLCSIVLYYRAYNRH